MTNSGGPIASGACVDSVQDVPVSGCGVMSADTQTTANVAGTASSRTASGVLSDALRVEAEMRWQQSASWSS